MTEADPRAAREQREKSGDAARFLQTHREEHHEALERMSETWEEGAEDQAFLASEQWDPGIAKDREDDDRPVMTFPKLTQFHDSLVGNEMQQRPSIKIRAADGVASGKKMRTAAGKVLTRAETYAGLVRQIERQSDARMAYDTAFDHTTGWGWGHFRIDRNYVEDSFDQELFINPILDPFATVWDGSATDYLRLEANWCDVSTWMTKAVFERRYPGAIASSMDLQAVQYSGDWVRQNDLRLVEHFRKEEIEITLLLMSNGEVYRHDEKFEKVKDELAAQGVLVKRDRKQKTHRVEWYLLSALDILEGPIEVPGRYIPIVPMWGRPMWKNGRVVYRGLIRNAKDEQRAYNYTRTTLIEKQALAPRAPWVLTPEQIEGHGEMWDNAHKKNYPYLLANAQAIDGTPLPLPQRQFGQVDVASDIALLQLSEQGMKSSIGVYDPTLGQNRDQRSGRALAIEGERTDTMTFPFMGAAQRSIAHCGRILVEQIPRIYNGDRIARILHEDEGEDTIEINTVVVDEDTGEKVTLNDVTVGRYDVTCDIGPGYLTRRMEAIDSLLAFLEKLPNAAPLLGDLIAQNADWPPGIANEAARRLKLLLPPELQDDEASESDDPEVARIKLQVKQVTQMLEEKMGMMQEGLQKVMEDRDHLKAQADKLNVQLTAERESHGLDQQRAEIQYEKQVLKLERAVDKLMGQVDALTRQAQQREAEQNAKTKPTSEAA